jgi:hypothetical protein
MYAIDFHCTRAPKQIIGKVTLFPPILASPAFFCLKKSHAKRNLLVRQRQEVEGWLRLGLLEDGVQLLLRLLQLFG